MDQPTRSDAAPPADPEQAWLERTWQPGATQLTARAVVVGMLIGVVMCLSNLYVFFKTGWSMGVTITAALLAFAAFRAAEAVGLVKRPLTALENNALTTVSSGAGYMTGGGNMAAFGALMMVTTVRPDWWPMVAWFAAIAALGVFTAIPIKRQLVNREALAFPTGTATAETLKAIHAAEGPGGGEGSRQATALGLTAVGAALMTWLRSGKVSWMPWNLPESFAIPVTLAGRALKDWTFVVKTEVVLVGAGALMSFRTGWSVLLGGVLTYAVLAPALVARGVVGAVGYKAIVGWTVWPGAAVLVGAGLTSFALDWRSVARSLSGLTGLFSRRPAAADPIDAVECPGWWFPAGFAVLGPVVVLLMAWLFQIPWWAGVLAVPLAVVMGFVAARVTGETDVTPTKALGPVTQLLYGVITPGNLSGNIMSANVTGGIGLHAADLLTTLKTGWLLGASPRAQFWAQLFGVAAGAAVVVPAFHLIIGSDPAALGSETWPAPSCLVWAGVSQAFAGGVGSLDPLARSAIVAGLLLGIALAVAEKLAPRRALPWVPSPAGLGIAMVIPGSNSVAMFLGALGAWAWRRWGRASADRYVTPVASGLIAGESLMGVAIALLVAAGVLAR
jgi:uncharacterized oligopeptide transporter (OPT) family protein